jgi:hypothetical protein
VPLFVSPLWFSALVPARPRRKTDSSLIGSPWSPRSNPNSRTAITPLATTTPRLEQEFRYDVQWQTHNSGVTMDN